ncbi:MAG: calcium-binding protein, partial [Clostridiales bacterium]|nr:calcium-binding protein [Clostridiales bacterium]
MTNDIRMFYDKDGKVIGYDTSSIVGGNSVDVPSNSKFETTVGDVRNFSSDIEMSAKYTGYDSLSDLDKVQARQAELEYNKLKIDLDKIPISQNALADYATAAGKTADKLNDVDKLLIKAADAITGGSSNTAETLAKFAAKYKKLSKVGKKALPIVDVVFTTIDFGQTIYSAVNAYNRGDYNTAAGLIVSKTAEFAVSNVGGWAITGAIGPYFMGFGAAVGGPIGAGIGAILAGAIGYGIAGIIGSSIGDAIMDLFGLAEDAAAPRIDPLVIDLNGNGFTPTSVKDGAYFDLDQNGFAEKMGWINGDDALLAIDKNRDGKINDGSELFGDKTLLKNGKYAQNGFEALKEYDTNKDGIISQGDIDFDSLLLWQDINGNGISENGELISLKDAGIDSIKLGYKSFGEVTESGTILGNVATFVKANGDEFQIAEYWVKNESYNTKDLNSVEISEDILELPDVKGMGIVPTLHKAMAIDETGRVKELVKEFKESTDNTLRFGIVEQILKIVTGAENIDVSSRGGNFDAQKLLIIESMLGKGFKGVNGVNPNVNAATQLNNVYSDLINSYYCELIAQTSLKSILPYIRIINNEDGKAIDLLYLKLCLPILLKENELSQISDLAKYIKYLDKSGTTGFEEFKKYFEAKSYDFLKAIAIGADIAVIGTNQNETLNATIEKNNLFANDGNDRLNGSSGNDILDGGAGNDTLVGGAGEDVYIFGKGYGQDIISDGSGKSTIRFLEGIEPEDLVVSREGNYHVKIQIKGTED